MMDRTKYKVVDDYFYLLLFFIQKLGNEAADADSIISSICLSYLRHHIAKNTSTTTTTTTDREVYHLPILPLPKEDFPLRTETTMLFKMVGLETRCAIMDDDGG